jgi:GntR family transcriptional regulator/MocR family aminotransferase
MYETSQPIELLLSVAREDDRTLGVQIEDQLREAVRSGALRPGARLPSTRDLARQLGVSRRVVVDAYGQLAAAGYVELRQGARPAVPAVLPAAPVVAPPAAPAPAPPRFDFRPSAADVSAFPRRAWARALRDAVATMPDTELGDLDPRGLPALRGALAAYVGRVRGVVADPEHMIITCGYTEGLGLVCRALGAAGARRLAVENPCNLDQRAVVERAGLAVVSVGVDAEGLVVDALARSGADAVVVTPAHQHPTGVVLSGARRSALLAWLRERDAVAVEDDYDAEYRYDRAAVGALQALDPARVVYAGSTSKTLAPALRLGWLVLPPSLTAAAAREKTLTDLGTGAIEQRALADLVVRGEVDRHLRRMRVRYRARRDALLRALAAELPDARVRGIAAGLHVTVELPPGHDEADVRESARAARIELTSLRDYTETPDPSAPVTLMLGYGRIPDASIPAGIRALARALT